MWSTQLQRFPGCPAEGKSLHLKSFSASKHTFPLKIILLLPLTKCTSKNSCLVTCLFLAQNQPPAEKLKLKEGRRKKKTKQEVTKEREDECFSCGDGGQIVSCKKPGCPKVYHADCLNLAKRPAGK